MTRDALKPPHLRVIGIWGHYHGGNQGDECIVTTLIQHIRARCPEVEIRGFSQGPADTQERYGIRAFPIQRAAREGTAYGRSTAGTGASPGGLRGHLRELAALRRIVRRLRSSARSAMAVLQEPLFLLQAHRSLRDVDLLIVAGSGPLFDAWRGPWSHPYTVFKWALLCRLSGTRFVPLCVGGGPLNAPLSRFFIRTALRGAWYRSYRDPSSAALIASLPVEGEHPVLPDLAFGLDPRPMLASSPKREVGGGRPVVGLNPMAHSDSRYLPRGDTPAYRSYVEKLADFAEWLIRNDYTVVLVYSQVRFDPNACRDLVELLKQKPDLDLAGRVIDSPIHDLQDLIEQIALCDCLVSARYHCIVLPQLMGKPVIGLAYHPKTVDLMASMGQADYCLDIDAFEVEDLVDCFRRLRANADAISSELGSRVPEARARIEEQYDRLLGPVSGQDA